MRSRFLMLPLFGLMLIAGCRQPQFDSASEGKKLLQRDAEWAQLASEGKDVDKVVSYWTDDAKLIEPGEPIYAGKAAIRAFVADSFKMPGFRIHWVSRDPVFSPDGKLAYLSSNAETTLPGKDGALMTIHSQGITVWRLESDGQWRCVIDISNEAPHS
jgi:ketosteroid isomerase-like protein